MVEPTAADLRAVAVAKLKRAASLPRMKDGRRPPMHGEAVSEGERRTNTPDVLPPSSGNGQPEDIVEGGQVTPSEEPDESKAQLDEEPPSSSGRETPSKTTKRRGRSRSRSRSRSRGSKDFKEAAARAELQRLADSSPEEQPPPVPVLTPQPSPIASQFTTGRTPRGYIPSPSPHHFLHSPTAPHGALPSLDALRAGLIRSNSAAARMIALNKLTGGRDSPEPRIVTSPSPGSSLGRNNTVTGAIGGERLAARKRMLERLGERKDIKEVDGELTSGGEDVILPVMQVGLPPGGRRRKATSISNTVIDDRDLPSTEPGTPQASPSHTTPVLPTSDPPGLSVPPMPQSPTGSTAERERDSTLAKLTGEDNFEYDLPRRNDVAPNGVGRGVLIEEDLDDILPRPRMTASPFNLASRKPTPPAVRQPHSSDAPSSTSSISTSTSLDRIPVFLQEQGQKSPYDQDAFPVTISPFGTPSKEKLSADEDEEGERVVYPEDMRDRKAFLGRMESNVSWIGVDEDLRLLHDPSGSNSHSSIDEEPQTIHEVIVHPEPAPTMEPERNSEIEIEETIPVPVIHSNEVSTDSVHVPNSDTESAPETAPSIPNTPSSAFTFSNGTSTSGISNHVHSISPPPPARDSVASSTSAAISPSHLPLPHPDRERSRTQSLTDWEELQTDREGLTDRESTHRLERSPSLKKRESSTTSSRWERVKTTFTGGRRSRSNSFVRTKRDDKVESGTSRESGASGKTDHTAPASSQSQAVAAASSLLSMSTNTVPRGVSPIPPLSHGGMAKYTDPKLMPLPGILRLEEEMRTRVRKTSTSARPDALPYAGTVPNTRVNSPEPHPGLIHQASDSRLLAKYQLSTTAPFGATTIQDPEQPRQEYFDIPPNASASTTPKLTLPQTREGALRWITQRKLWSSQTSGHGANGSGSSDSGTVRMSTKKKPSLTDLFPNSRGGDSGTEKEDSSPAAPRHNSRLKAESARSAAPSPALEIYQDPFAGPLSNGDSNHTNGIRGSAGNTISQASVDTYSSSQSRTTPAPSHRPLLSSGHTSASGALLTPPDSLTPPRSSSSEPHPSQSKQVMDLIESMLTQSSRQPQHVPTPLDNPPRKLLLSTFARQIVSPNEVKNRFLLLFNDIMVIAKFSDEESAKSSLDRTLLVRSVVDLHTLNFQLPHTDQAMPDFMQLTAVQELIRRFPSDPDGAIKHCIEHSSLTYDASTVGHLLFRAIGLNKRTLGDFLSRRSNKSILRAFVDRFGFKGMRLDNALRVFLLSLRLTTDAAILEHVLATFASRWFEANKGVVTFDRDLATRLVLAIMQLNDALHSGLESDDTVGGNVFSSPNHYISSRDFVEAFRVRDSHSLVSQDLLEKIYHSVRQGRLLQALDSSKADLEIPATFMPSQIPDRLTARVPSSKITIRIPQPDPHFHIHLHGQDLFFDPPILDFSTSSEASFVVIGASLGEKDMILARTGAHAARYSNIPLTKTFLVERSFMRNTFTINFVNHAGAKRKYRFNVADDEEYKKWKTVLKHRIQQRTEDYCSSRPSGPISADVRRAAESVAVQVLRDAVLSPEELVPALGERGMTSLSVPPRPAGRPKDSSKGGPITGHHLVLTCQQNSLIPVVLSFLQVLRHQDEEPAGIGGQQAEFESRPSRI